MEDSYPPPQILIYQKFQSIIVKGYINETERKEKKSFFFLEAITFYINLMKNARSTIAKFIAYKPYKLISQLVNMCVLYIN